MTDTLESDNDMCRCGHVASDHYFRRGFDGPSEYCAGSIDESNGSCGCPEFEEDDEA